MCDDFKSISEELYLSILQTNQWGLNVAAGKEAELQEQGNITETSKI